MLGVCVLHDGRAVFTAAYECLKSLKEQAKTVVIISNAARRAPEFDKELYYSGIDQSVFDFSISSGELTWQNFNNQHYTHLGENFFYMGPDRSVGVFKGLGLTQVDSLEKADFIINTGIASIDTNHRIEVSTYTEQLTQAAQRNLPMICANPDIVAIRKGLTGIAAGAIAGLYCDLGGEVIYVGKPCQQIYDHCFTKLDGIAKNKILMIGDGLQTDILGAANSGIDSVFITQGIYHQAYKEALLANNLKAFFMAECGAQPQYYLDFLAY